MSDTRETATQIAELGKRHANAASALMPAVYEELRRLAQRQMATERRDHTLQPTAVVHEAYVRLAGAGPVDDLCRSHFFALAAGVIRRVLIDHARKRLASKRGGSAARVRIEVETLNTPAREELDVLALDEALLELAAVNERQARVVEFRYFAGLGVTETAAVLGVSERTVKGEWRIARAWLAAKLR